MLKNCRFCRLFLLFYSILRHITRKAHENANLRKRNSYFFKKKEKTNKRKTTKKEEMVTYALISSAVERPLPRFITILVYFRPVWAVSHIKVDEYEGDRRDLDIFSNRSDVYNQRIISTPEWSRNTPC